MAKTTILSVFICILFFSLNAANDSACLSCVYLKELGVREATGHNDGPRVEEYLRSVGLKQGQPWCAAFVKWCFNKAGVRTPIDGRASSAHNPRNLVWYSQQLLKEPKPGDTFTLFSPSLHRISHTGFFHQRLNDALYISVEGNTNAGGSREGDGVYMRKRSFRSTYSISRWTS